MQWVGACSGWVHAVGGCMQWVGGCTMQHDYHDLLKANLFCKSSGETYSAVPTKELALSVYI